MDGARLYLRARYYNPGMGVFPSLDPFEGMHGRPMSLNGYLYVGGNPSTNTDPSGMYWWEGSPVNFSNPTTQYDTENYMSHVIQSIMAETPILEEVWHAEYQVDVWRGDSANFAADLVYAPNSGDIELFEVKPYSRDGKRRGPNQVSNSLAHVQGGELKRPDTGQVYATSEGGLNQSGCVYSNFRYPHPTRGFSYNWCSDENGSRRNWKIGSSFPRKVYIGPTANNYKNGKWYAGLRDDPGVIYYWYEEDEEDPDVEAYPGTRVRQIPRSISDEQSWSVEQSSSTQGQVIPFDPNKELEEVPQGGGIAAITPTCPGVHHVCLPFNQGTACFIRVCFAQGFCIDLLPIPIA